MTNDLLDQAIQLSADYMKSLSEQVIALEQALAECQQTSPTWHKWPDELPPVSGKRYEITALVHSNTALNSPWRFSTGNVGTEWTLDKGWDIPALTDHKEYAISLFFWRHLANNRPDWTETANVTPLSLRDWQALADELHGGLGEDR